MRYLDLYSSGELLTRVRAAHARLRSCNLCPHNCGVNRLKGESGICKSGCRPRVASANVHWGEEPPISGTRGSGTVFLSGCSLHCRFCQNFPISQLGNGADCTTPQLADKMIKLQNLGVHNINFVTPTHFMPQILAALHCAIGKGFRLPLLWNSSGFERVDALELLDGLVDVYLPDMKYSSNEPAERYSSAPGYHEHNRSAVTEMFRQVGHLHQDNEGIALKGLIIRHLVLPEDAAGTRETLQWIAAHLGMETHVSLMKQFFPAHEAPMLHGLNRKITDQEYEAAVASLDEANLENGWIQE